MRADGLIASPPRCHAASGVPSSMNASTKYPVKYGACAMSSISASVHCTCSAGTARSAATVVALSWRISWRVTLRPRAALEGPQPRPVVVGGPKAHGPDCRIAREKSDLAAGEMDSVHERYEPDDWPKRVTSAARPPKAPMCRCTHRSATTMSYMPFMPPVPPPSKSTPGNSPSGR